MTVQAQLERVALGKAIDAIFRSHGVTDGFGYGDFVVTDHLVTDFLRADQRVSNAIVEHTWPRQRKRALVHYTRRANAQSIIDTGCMRLYELYKRVTQHEMVDFFRHHGFLGYLQVVNGRPVYYDAMKKLFYASFTSTALLEHEESYMWDEFAPGRLDVKLTFDVEAQSSDLRLIKYVSEFGTGVPLIRQLQARVNAFGGRSLMFRGVTRVAAFYLRGCYEEEQEIRLLHARYDDMQSDVHKDRFGHRYVELPLDGQFHLGFRLVPSRVETREGVDQELTAAFSRLGRIATL